ncbi:hypothetical protein DFH06DRAFT_1289614 [Mycena polygramma]|nr:hypothetical protein DFH06DRAFT_1289614 [Mycena polygramma]
MARTSQPRGRKLDPVEHGDHNPLDDNEIRGPENIILKVTLTTSSPTLSISNPDPTFRLFFDVAIFYTPHPDSPLTISTGRSTLDVMAYWLGGIHLLRIAEGPQFVLKNTGIAHPQLMNFRNKDLLRDPEFHWMKFITIPASGSTRVELPLRFMLSDSHTVKREDLKPGMKYRVCTKNEFLTNLGSYSYSGDLAGDLKDKKLSNYPFEQDGSPSDPSDYLADVVAGEGWALQCQDGYLDVRGNVGKFGPVIEFVE